MRASIGFVSWLFLQATEDLGSSLASLSACCVAPEGSLGHPSKVLKALRWLVRKLEPQPFPDLWSVLFAFCTGIDRLERKESVPFPCAFLAWLEKSIVESSFGEEVIAFAGDILLCSNASLRFSDSQHVDWTSFVLAHSVFRAVFFRTKTSQTGVLFWHVHRWLPGPAPA